MQLDWSKTAKQFPANSHRKLLFVIIRRAGKQVLGLQFTAFQVVILVKYSVLFILGKCLLDSEQVILIFTEVWSYNFHVSR